MERHDSFLGFLKTPVELLGTPSSVYDFIDCSALLCFCQLHCRKTPDGIAWRFNYPKDEQIQEDNKLTSRVRAIVIGVFMVPPSQAGKYDGTICSRIMRMPFTRQIIHWVKETFFKLMQMVGRQPNPSTSRWASSTPANLS
ncbi:hypothetical protein CEXT_591731 [Caerostris extrusa]|uniref:Uncharacterized protein n=1 Tax=Caerostris extrusa TaxID=172846 RepID=A0AAV4XE33_CAEEX|nr:hypothetical protein CEXT_591731 [Caerostris extrusa]